MIFVQISYLSGGERILKMVKIWWSYCYEIGVFRFWGHGVLLLSTIHGCLH